MKAVRLHANQVNRGSARQKDPIGRILMLPYVLVFALLASVWALPFGQPAFAQVLLPPNFLSSSVPPHDVSAGATASPQDLAIFAWQEFVALNWPALDPATTGMRGRPDPTKQFTDANPGLTVWQTYRHKNEQFPGDKSSPDPNFDSSAPKYSYASFVTLKNATPSTSRTLFNNLDESSEIGLCIMFAHLTTRVLYEAKVNRAAYDYTNEAGLTNPANSYQTLSTKKEKTLGDLKSYGGICNSSDADEIVMLPCGNNAVAGDAGEGAIEVKAAWRKLTDAEAGSGRFYVNEVIYYEQEGSDTIVENDKYGLIGFHIIHKTVSFPTFVFATWEQVDNYDATNSGGLKFVNTGSKPAPNIPVTRDNPIPATVETVNQAVHDLLSGTGSVWRYYKLIGVQAKPVNGPPQTSAPADTLSYYYLANIVIETNQVLQMFYGLTPNSMIHPGTNLYQGGNSFQMGGCQGCHGVAQLGGGDMSFLITKAPNNTLAPETINADEETTVKTMRLRSGFAQ